MKFKVELEDEQTLARKGLLTINHKTIKTPILWLGYPIRSDPKPWKEFRVDSILVNAYDIILRTKIFNFVQHKGIHRFLDYSALIMMDSGGFLFQTKNRLDISPDIILDLYHKSRPDIGVILDYPLNPLQSSYINYRRWKKTIDNTIYMYQNNGTSILMPILHGYTLRKLKNACKEIKKIDPEPNLIGLGSLVPLIFRTKGMHNFDNSMKFVVDAIMIVKKEFPNAFLHVFGIGSTNSMHLIFSLGVDSLDSTGWRLKAAYGRIQLPGIGDRYVKKHSNNRRVINEKEKRVLASCKCPVCKDLNVEDQIKTLDSSFKTRALHNAWVFVKEEKRFKDRLTDGCTEDFVRERLGKSPFLKGFEYFMKRRGK